MLRLNVCKWLVLSLPLALGCAAPPLTTPVSLPLADAPNAGQLANVRRIAILDITGPIAPLGEVMTNTTAARLMATGRFTVADRPTILQAGFNVQSVPNGVSAEQAALFGLRVNADAVLFGEASFAMVPGAPAPLAPPLGALPPPTPQTPAQQMQVTVNYRLIDAHTKQPLFSDRQILVLDTTPSKTYEQMQQLLADQFATKVLQRLAAPPATRPMSREFAIDPLGLVKDTLLSRGNRFAANGVFDEAAKLYMQALAEKPDCHEALYNLGLLAEGLGNLPAANQYFEKAMRKNDCTLYIQAYQRTRTPQG